MQITDLGLGKSLTVVKGKEKIIWRKVSTSSGMVFRRYHFKNKELMRVIDNNTLGSSENLDLEFLLASGWKRV
jgi:hypothetical protein